MPILTATEHTALNRLLELSHSACRELEDSMETTNMSDSKAAAFEIKEAAKTLPLPAYCADFLHICAEEIFLGTLSSTGDTYRRCGFALAAAGRFNKVIDLLKLSDEDMRNRGGSH